MIGTREHCGERVVARRPGGQTGGARARLASLAPPPLMSRGIKIRGRGERRRRQQSRTDTNTIELDIFRALCKWRESIIGPRGPSIARHCCPETIRAGPPSHLAINQAAPQLKSPIWSNMLELGAGEPGPARPTRAKLVARVIA